MGVHLEVHCPPNAVSLEKVECPKKSFMAKFFPSENEHSVSLERVELSVQRISFHLWQRFFPLKMNIADEFTLTC